MRHRLLDSLRTRMILLTAGALLPAIALIGQDHLARRAEVLAAATADAARYRDAMLRAHGRVLESTRQLLAALARIQSVRRNEAAESSALLAALKAEHPIYQNLFANRPDGSVFASAEPLPGPVNAADASWFQAAARGDGFVVGDYRTGRITGKWVLTLAYPVRDDSGRLEAVVGAALPLEWFAGARASHALAPQAAISLFTAGGRIIGHFGQGEETAYTHLQQRVGPAGPEEGTLWLGEGDDAWIYAYSYLLDGSDGDRVYLAVGIPAQPALAGAEKMLRDDLLRILLVAGLVFLGGAIASRLVIEAPVRRMLEATRRLAAGDLSARSGVHAGPRELAELGRHFDAMAATLEGRTVELTRYQQELEQLARETEQRRRAAEERSQAYQRELHAVMQRVQDVIFRLDLQGRLVWATPSIATMSGYALEELLNGDLCACMADPGDRDRMLTLLREGGGRLRDFELRIRRKDGGQCTAALNAQYVYGPEGEPVGVEGVARDISEQVRSREQLVGFNRRLEERVRERTVALERINTELEAFTYSVSHDLRAPLRGIEGFAKIMIMRHAPRLPEEGRDYLERIQRAARRMARLIDDLLSLSRINRYELSFADVDLSAMAQEVIEELRGFHPERQVEVRIAPGLRCRCDARLSRVLLTNLLENAWKYTRTRSAARIEFDLRDEADGPAFRIRDNGVGFDMSYANKLFAPFQRLHPEEQFEGTGIGLATVMRVIKRHSGEIWVDAAPGRGAEFCFRLCAGQPPRAEAA